jgi:3-deoxy-D-manno-octulosonate 8-phosphate phosphatase (KDO 8-P phosphatase)
VERKLTAFERLLKELALEPEQAACMGDDLPDLPLLERCVLAVTVPDAPDLVRARAHYVSRRRGGHGAVREVCELILAAQDELPNQLEKYLT